MYGYCFWLYVDIGIGVGIGEHLGTSGSIWEHLGASGVIWEQKTIENQVLSSLYVIWGQKPCTVEHFCHLGSKNH